MRVCVTGGSGFLGGHIVQELEKCGESVTIVDLKPPLFMTEAEFIKMDVTNTFPVRCPSDAFQVIFHAAGSLGTHTTFDRIKETFSVNVMGMVNLLDWICGPSPASDSAFPKVINCGLIRDWLNPYMVSKHTASKIGSIYSDVFGVPFLDVRMTVVYGPRQGWKEEKVVPRFILQSLRSLPMPIYGVGDSLMNMMYVKDVARILVELSHQELLFGIGSPRRLDLANPEGDISVKAFAEAVLSGIDPHATIHSRAEHQDMRRGQPGSVGLEYDLTSAFKYIPDLASKFRPLSEGLEHTIDWYRGQL